jgi:spoIIIJ-associated protein
MSQVLSIESVGPDVESAILKGIEELGVDREQVIVEVLEEPRSRLLGLGMKQARVRLTMIRAPETPAPNKAEKAAPPPAATSAPKPEKAEKPEKPAAKPRRAPKAAKPDPVEPHAEAVADTPIEAPMPPVAAAEEATPTFDFEEDDETPARPVITPKQLAEEAEVGATVLRQMLEALEIRATVVAQPANSEESEPQHWTLQIQGSDLGVLIGKRGETLAALQYLTRLITSREIGHRAYLVVDVEGYKQRREEMLKRLALRMAEQAIQRGRTVSMEPMPPHERRIIHLTLRNNPDVTTESIGEGENRKVTVVPRKQS